MLDKIKKIHRCFVEKGLWYTWHKIMYKLFGSQDPVNDPRWLKKHEEHKQKTTTRNYSRIANDIIIISGVNENNVPQCLRYRVLHPIEQLRACGFSVEWIPYELCTQFSVLNCRMAIFYRCPYTEGIGAAIKMAKSLNIPVYYDIDDLVFDTYYTNQIPNVRKLNGADKDLYDDGVMRMGKTMQQCEYGITTTEQLKEEMEKMLPSVFINRNCASEEMVLISDSARRNKKSHFDVDEVVIGYFSGSLTHNSDFEMILPALVQLLDRYDNVKIVLMGQIDLPAALIPYSERIVRKKLVNWRKLPEIIASVDLNLAPLENTVFNASKSEIKWMEASLVGVCTVASRVGAFERCIQDGTTGFLCSENEWYNVLSMLVCNRQLREQTAKNAYHYCRKNYISTQCNIGIRDFLNKTSSKHIGFVLPSCEISGGIMVALWHASFLQDNGWQVDIIANGVKSLIWEFQGHKFAIYSREDVRFDNRMSYDVLVATMWTTVEYVLSYKNVKKRCYLVQNYETDFYSVGQPERIQCESTYNIGKNIQYLTISKWCYEWLTNHYKQQVFCATNGIQSQLYPIRRRDFTNTRKIRILIEGDCAVEYKNVDESFAIVDSLDPNRFEVWYMSYNAKPKNQYRYDKFLHKVPYDKVGQVYADCDILIKSSWLESFSYPPLEMMATGGFCVVVPNGGNQEYLVDGVNCLQYTQGRIHEAVSAIERICADSELRLKLEQNGQITAKKHEWSLLAPGILKMYENLVE